MDVEEESTNTLVSIVKTGLTVGATIWFWFSYFNTVGFSAISVILSIIFSLIFIRGFMNGFESIMIILTYVFAGATFLVSLIMDALFDRPFFKDGKYWVPEIIRERKDSKLRGNPTSKAEVYEEVRRRKNLKFMYAIFIIISIIFGIFIIIIGLAYLSSQDLSSYYDVPGMSRLSIVLLDIISEFGTIGWVGIIVSMIGTAEETISKTRGIFDVVFRR